MPARSHPTLEPEQDDGDEVAERVQALERQLLEARSRVVTLERALRVAGSVLRPYLSPK